MELLRRISILLVMGTLAMAVSAQDFEKKREAFRKSYELETGGDFEKAVAELKTVYDDKSYEINLRLGWLTYLSGDMISSINYYKKAIAIMPYAVEPRFGIAYPSTAIGNIDEALNQYRKILEITPNNSVAHYWIGVIYYNRAEYDSAKKSFEKGVNLFPFDYDNLVMLGWTNLKMGNAREAKVLFQKALLNNPTGASALEGLSILK